MQIAQAYIKGRAISKYSAEPSSGFEKHSDGIYYPSWATDYLVVSAQLISDAYQNVVIPASVISQYIYGDTIAAGQEAHGYCLIYHTNSWSFVATYAGWSIDRCGVGASRACIYTFANLAETKMAMVTGNISRAVWNSSASGHNFNLYGAKHQGGYPYFIGLTGVYSVEEARDGDSGETYVSTISTQDLGTYYASKGWRIKQSDISVSNNRYLWSSLYEKPL